MVQCDDSLRAILKPDGNTKILLVKYFKKGEPLVLSDVSAKTPAPNAPQNLCLVKILVGPGSPGRADAPSTSVGIGIEVWLPDAVAWNQRIRNLGGGGWAGGDHSSLSRIGNASAAMSTTAGYAVGTTDTGHVIGAGSFAMREDGSINSALWYDFADRSLNELAIKSKALVESYYGRRQKYAYWEGCSTGGRQGFKMAQEHPEHYDGYLNAAPAINWTRFITSELYPQVVMQRDLGGPMSAEKLAHVSAAAVSACDVVGGRHLGFILDPAQCRYDPTRDASVLCRGVRGSGVTGSSDSPACVTHVEASAFNKFWYGQTVDGSVPDPQHDNASAAVPRDSKHLWWGLERGTNLAYLAARSDVPPFFGPFPIASDIVALELESASYATPAFVNVRGNGMSRWKALTYADLTRASMQGVSLQPQFGHINTDNPNLSKLREKGARIITYHGLADELITHDGTVNYFTRMMQNVGGEAAAQEFSRLYLIPGMGHCFGVGSVSGTTSPAANLDTVPLPKPDQFFDALVNWVERGQAPNEIVLSSGNGAVTLPTCTYPKKVTYRGSGEITSAASYLCQ